MQIKKFIGDDTASVMAQIRDEFGNNAMILETNTVKTGGLFGFFTKSKIEILAAVENDAKKTRPAVRKAMDVTQEQEEIERPMNDFRSDFRTNLGYAKNIANQASQINQKQIDISRLNQYKEPINQKYNRQFQIEKKPAHELERSKEEIEFKDDIDQIKKTVMNLSKKINDTFRTPEEEEEYLKFVNQVQALVKTGMSKELAERVIENSKKFGTEYTNENILNSIINIFSDYKPDERKEYRYNIFIGPTGVGKTTTLAKVASNAEMGTNKKQAFLTMDTYRISAVEQLKTYAQILSVPIEVAYEIDDLEGAVQRLSSRDIIYIDTAGRSHKNKKQIMELKKILDSFETKKTYLFLSATTNLDDIYDIIDTYSFIDDYYIIVTKTDETSKMGKIFDIINYSERPISFITDGQNVPDDLKQFDFNSFVNEFVKGF